MMFLATMGKLWYLFDDIFPFDVNQLNYDTMNQPADPLTSEMIMMLAIAWIMIIPMTIMAFKIADMWNARKFNEKYANATTAEDFESVYKNYCFLSDGERKFISREAREFIESRERLE